VKPNSIINFVHFKNKKKMIFLYKIILFATLFLFTIQSCGTKKNVIYFQDGDVKNTELSIVVAQNQSYTPTLKIDDLLTIYVNADNPESALPYNQPVLGNGNNNVGYSSGTPSLSNCYLIDANGEINFPIIGIIHIEGMNRMEAVKHIESLLDKYLSNPIVNIKIVNFKISVLGEVAKPGTFNIPNERITILEAIGIAGDLTITGKRKNVMVIREEDNHKVKYHVDLTSNDLFSSPIYYLNQNDIVYVEPNRVKINSSLINTSNAGIIISGVSLFITTLVLLTK
jgi:polysaccharide biosynthesis/export protein